jgi:hypothetical protein
MEAETDGEVTAVQDQALQVKYHATAVKKHTHSKCGLCQ